MRVLLLTTHLQGGAGIACRRLWEGLQECEPVQVASLIYRHGASLSCLQWCRESGSITEEWLYENPQEWPDERLSILTNQNRTPFSSTYFSVSEVSNVFDRPLAAAIDEHDVVNLHWTSGLVSGCVLKYLSESGKPVLITLHDLNHFTGGCHYPAECVQFRTGCLACPQVAGTSNQDIVRKQHALKKQFLCAPNIFWTGPSEWIVQLLQSSGMAHDHTHVLNSIKNPIQDQAPPNADFVRSIAGLSGLSSAHLGIIADDLSDLRKGGECAVEAIGASFTHLLGPLQIHLVGSESQACALQLRNYIREHAAEARSGGSISICEYGRLSPENLGYLLGQIDVLIFPSFEENYSNLLIEAISSGCQVVAFPVGGNLEIARRYPSDVKLVELGFPIELGVNANARPDLQALMQTRMSDVIVSTLNALRPDSADRHTHSCGHDHSRFNVCSQYVQAFQHVLDWTHNRNSLDVPRIPVPQQFMRDWLPLHLATYPLDALDQQESVFLLRFQHNRHWFVPANSTLLILCLQPSQDDSYLSRRLNCLDFRCASICIFRHSQHGVKQFPGWDTHLLSITACQDSSLRSELFLDCSEETGIPALLAWVSWDEVPGQGLMSLDQLILASLVGDTIIPPMAGLADYSLSEAIDITIGWQEHLCVPGS
jgi:glycosyltransferase involved in cell wall biosynthesis